MPMPRKGYTFIIICYIIAAFILPNLLTPLFSNFFRFKPQTVALLIDFFSYWMLTIIIIVLMRRPLIREFKKLKLKKYLSPKVLAGLLLGFILLFLGSVAVRIFLPGASHDSVNQQAVRTLVNIYPIPLFFVTVFYGPLVEEIVFRFILMNTLKTSNWIKILTSGILFGLIHVIGTDQLSFVVFYGIIGIIYAYIYDLTKNIWLVISIHALQNFIAFAGSFLVDWIHYFWLYYLLF